MMGRSAGLLLQLLTIISTLSLLCHGLVASEWSLKCGPSKRSLHMYDIANVTCDIEGPAKVYSEYMLVISSDDHHVVKADNEIWLKYGIHGIDSESFNITAQFLGKAKVSVKIQQRNKIESEVEEIIEVTVTRQKRVIDVIFHVSVVVLVSVMYINFGAALNWGDLKTNIKRPVGPIIGFVGQFLIMPLLSFGIGKLLFPGNVAMQLGMFFTGASPAGGASNMWTVILGGNIDLSITMTTLGTFAAFAMMPFWLFTLGRVLFHEGNIEVPYDMISKYAICLVIPLFLGFLIQRYLKRVGKFLARILKGLSSFLLLFIIVFAIVSNLYLFELFSWQITVAGLFLPLFGYTLAWVMAFICKQNARDCLTIAIETGIQNTGIAIFLLRFSLNQPEADLTTVVPVAVAVMTPIPLFCYFIYQHVQKRCCMKHGKLDTSELNSPMSELESDSHYHAKGPKLISTLS